MAKHLTVHGMAPHHRRTQLCQRREKSCSRPKGCPCSPPKPGAGGGNQKPLCSPGQACHPGNSVPWSSRGRQGNAELRDSTTKLWYSTTRGEWGSGAGEDMGRKPGGALGQASQTRKHRRPVTTQVRLASIGSGPQSPHKDEQGKSPGLCAPDPRLLPPEP